MWDWAPQANDVGITLAGSCREADSEPTRQQNVIPPTARIDTARTARVTRKSLMGDVNKLLPAEVSRGSVGSWPYPIENKSRS